MIEKFNYSWNSHYDFQNQSNVREIVFQNELNIKGIDFLPPYKPQGGQIIESPWGSNQTIAAGKFSIDVQELFASHRYINPDALSKVNHDPSEFCRKVIIISPGGLLSLQRHRGRQEIWEVAEGNLTAIVDGALYNLGAGQRIFIAQGVPHCMINISSVAVKVNELQTGICREADNVRLLDCFNRPIYPLTSEVEYISAKLYADICRNEGVMASENFKGYPELQSLLKT